MEAVLEGRDNPKVPAAPAYAPKEIRVFRGAGGQEAPISRDQIDREQIITREPVFPGQPTQTPAQREARDARRGVRAAGGGQAKRLGLMIELAPRDPAFRTGCPAHGVNTHALHPRQINHETAVTHRVAWDVVATAPHRHQQTVGAGALHGIDDVGNPSAAGNQRGPFVDHTVPHRAGGIIAGVAREDEGAAQTSLELLESRFVKNSIRGHDSLISHHYPLALCVGSTSLAAERIRS